MFYVVAIAVVLADQLSKYLVRASMVEGQTIPLWKGIIGFTYYRNRGAAFGILPHQTWLFLLIAAVVVGFVLYMERRVPRDRFFLRTAMALLLGGAVGNVIDRVIFGQVTDFIQVQFVRYPDFNLADSAIVIAVAMIVFDSLRKRDEVQE